MSPMDIPCDSRCDKHSRISFSKGKEILISSPAAIYDRHPTPGLSAIRKLTTAPLKGPFSLPSFHPSFLPLSTFHVVLCLRNQQNDTINEPERDMIISLHDASTLKHDNAQVQRVIFDVFGYEEEDEDRRYESDDITFRNLFCAVCFLFFQFLFVFLFFQSKRLVSFFPARRRLRRPRRARLGEKTLEWCISNQSEKRSARVDEIESVPQRT